MARMRKKSDLPEKYCLHCARPFTWRRKWARSWAEIRFCSQACKAACKRGEPAARPNHD